MGKDRGAITVRGEVLDVTVREGKTTKGQDYRFEVLTVLAGKDTYEVRWSDSDDLGVCPREDDHIEVEVSLDVFNGRQQINAERKVVKAAPSFAKPA